MPLFALCDTKNISQLFNGNLPSCHYKSFGVRQVEKNMFGVGGGGGGVIPIDRTLPLNLTLDKKPQRNSTWRSKQNARMHNKTKYKPFYYQNKAIQYLTQVEVIAFRLKDFIILTL